MKRHFLFALFIVILFPAYPADTLNIREKIFMDSSPIERIPAKVWDNPAMMYYAKDYSLSNIQIGANSDSKGEAALKQEGNGSSNFGVNARSFVILNDKSKVFGEAHYKNGKRKNAIWNETSDFALLYPYVTGDSIGGNLNFEEYFFAGGYAHRIGKWTLGAKLDYRALIEYRNRDPRPKNVVSDLHATIGAGHAIGSNYQLGIAVHVRKYDQKSEISFYNDLGSTSVYHLTGLGMDYIRFAGDKKSSLYKGSAFSGSIDLLPAKGKGFFATANYKSFAFTKYLTDINKLPLVHMKENTLNGQIGYLNKKAGINYGIRADITHSDRTGTENIFGDPVSGVYPQISKAQQYKSEQTHAVLTGIIGNNRKKQFFVWSTLPYIGWQKINSAYKSAGRSMEFSSIKGGVNGNTSVSFSKSIIGLTAGIAYQANINSKMELAGMNVESSRYQTLLSDYNYLSDSHADINLALNWNYMLNKKQALQANVRWAHGTYKNCGATNLWEASLGFIF